MTLSRDLSGTGAMLVRLLGLGARGGLTPETTLLHVLDGVPLPIAQAHRSDEERMAGMGEARISPEASAELLERIRKGGPGPVIFPESATRPAATATAMSEADRAGTAPEPVLPVDDYDESLCFGFPEADDPAQQDRLDALNAEAIERELGDGNAPAPVCRKPWSPLPGSKADQALDLWSKTQLDISVIAARLGSTPGAIRSIVKKARSRKEARAVRPAVTDAPETRQAIAEARSLPLKRDRAILLWNRTTLAPREIAAMIDSTGAAVSNCVMIARQQSSAFVSEGDERRGFRSSGSQDPNEAPDVLPEVATGPSHSPEGAEEVCAEAVDEPTGPADGAFPAPHEVVTPIEMGTVSQDQPAPVSPEETDTAARPAGPGLNSEGPVEQAIDAMVAGLAKKGDHRLEGMLDLFGSTTLTQREIATKLGLTEFKVSTLIKAARAGADPRVVAGDAARAALKQPPATPPAAAMPAPAKAPPIATAPATPAPATSPGSQPPGDLVALKHDQILTIDRGWVVGPTGSVKGFPLVNGALSALASGDLLPAAVVAQRSGARSGEAVLQQLQFWREDLGRIGIEFIRVGASDVRLRRKGGE